MNSLIYFFFNTIFFIGNYDDFFYRFIFIRFRKFNWLLTIDSHFNYNFSLRIDQILTSRRETFHLDRKWKHFTAIKTDLSNVTERKQWTSVEAMMQQFPTIFFHPPPNQTLISSSYVISLQDQRVLLTSCQSGTISHPHNSPMHIWTNVKLARHGQKVSRIKNPPLHY